MFQLMGDQLKWIFHDFRTLGAHHIFMGAEMNMHVFKPLLRFWKRYSTAINVTMLNFDYWNNMDGHHVA